MISKPKRVALYVRVSTDEQTVENQLQELRDAAQRHGWDIVTIFRDEGISGAKGVDKRPGFAKLSKGIARKDFDMVATWAVDRLGRSLQDLVGLLSEMNSKGVDLYLHKQGIDTSTPGGKAMFQMLGVFAEFERSMIQERVKAGLARAKNQGKLLGRPKVAPAIENGIRIARNEGMSINKIAVKFDVGVGTVMRVVKAAS